MSTPPEVPEWPDAPYSTVTWRRATLGGDSADEGLNPDWAARVGQTVRLIPSISGPVVYDPYGPDPITVDVLPVDCVINSNGYLTTAGGIPVNIVSTSDPLMSVQGWTWYVESFPNIRFTAPAGGSVDLSRYVLAPATDATKFWVDRIPDLVALIPSLRGVESLVTDGGDILITLSDQSEVRIPIPSGTWSSITDKPSVFPPDLPADSGNLALTSSSTHGDVGVVDGTVQVNPAVSEHSQRSVLAGDQLSLHAAPSAIPALASFETKYGIDHVEYKGAGGIEGATKLLFPPHDGEVHQLMTDRTLAAMDDTGWIDTTTGPEFNFETLYWKTSEPLYIRKIQNRVHLVGTLRRSHNLLGVMSAGPAVIDLPEEFRPGYPTYNYSYSDYNRSVLQEVTAYVGEWGTVIVPGRLYQWRNPSAVRLFVEFPGSGVYWEQDFQVKINTSWLTD